MSKQQSMEFIAGYIFNKIDKQLHENFLYDTVAEFDGMATIPKVWFGLKCSKQDSVDLIYSDKTYFIEKLTACVEEYFPTARIKKLTIEPVNQYIRFSYTFVKHFVKKKMTVNEIEKELGYKIEIVGDN